MALTPLSVGQPAHQKKLQKVDGGVGNVGSREEGEEKEQQKEKQRSRRQRDNVPAAAVQARAAAHGRGRGTSPRGRAPPGVDQRALCREYGHWRNEWPKRIQGNEQPGSVPEADLPMAGIGDSD